MNNKKLYAELAAKRLDSLTKHFDAQGIAVSSNELELIESTIYEHVFQPLDALTIIPVSAENNPALESLAYTMKERTGKAVTVADGTTVVPEAGGTRTKYSRLIETGMASYRYGVDSGAVAALTGYDQAREDAATAGQMIAEWHDDMALTGGDLFTGFSNDATLVAAVQSATWTLGTTTGKAMFEDVAAALNAIPEASDGAHNATVCAMPIVQWNALTVTAFDNTTPGDMAMDVLKRNFPGVQFVQWAALKDKGAAAVARIVCFEKKPANVVYRATVMFDQDLPIRDGLFQYKVGVRAKSAGTIWRYPLAGQYLDITIA